MVRFCAFLKRYLTHNRAVLVTDQNGGARDVSRRMGVFELGNVRDVPLYEDALKYAAQAVAEPAE